MDETMADVDYAKFAVSPTGGLNDTISLAMKLAMVKQNEQVSDAQTEAYQARANMYGEQTAALQEERQLKQAERQKMEHRRKDWVAIGADPATQRAAYIAFLKKYPEIAGGFDKASQAITKEQEQMYARQAWPVAAALAHDKPKVALENAENNMEAAARSGNKRDAAMWGQIVQSIAVQDKTGGTARTVLMMRLANYDPEKFAENMAKLVPAMKKERFADEEMALKKLKAQIDAKNAQAAQMNSIAANESNRLRQQELRAKIAERTQKVREMKDTYAEALNKNVTEVVRIIGMANDLANDKDGLEYAYGRSGAVPDAAMSLWSPAAGSWIASLNQLQAMLTFNERNKIKGTGQISDIEHKDLGTSATKLKKRTQEESAAEKELRNIAKFALNGLNKQLKRMGLSPMTMEQAMNVTSSSIPSEVILDWERGYEAQNPPYPADEGGGAGFSGELGVTGGAVPAIPQRRWTNDNIRDLLK